MESGHSFHAKAWNFQANGAIVSSRCCNRRYFFRIRPASYITRTTSSLVYLALTYVAIRLLNSTMSREEREKKGPRLTDNPKFSSQARPFAIRLLLFTGKVASDMTTFLALHNSGPFETISSLSTVEHSFGFF